MLVLREINPIVKPKTIDMDNFSLLAPTGAAKDYFDKTGFLKEAKKFRYLFIFEKRKKHWQLLLSLPKQPHQYDAEDLLQYMIDNELDEIMVHGGGYVRLSLGMKYITYFDKSPIFKSCQPLELHKFSNRLNFNSDVYTQQVAPISSADENMYYRSYTLHDIQKIIEDLRKLVEQ